MKDILLRLVRRRLSNHPTDAPPQTPIPVAEVTLVAAVPAESSETTPKPRPLRGWIGLVFNGWIEKSPGFYIGEIHARRSDRVTIVIQMTLGANNLTAENLVKKMERKLVSAFVTLETFRTCDCTAHYKCQFHQRTVEEPFFKGNPSTIKETHE